MSKKIEKTREEWAKSLSAMELQVARDKGTEPPYSGKYNNFKDDGEFVCVCCSEPVFDSKQKYDSGSGWPSFWQAVNNEAVDEKTDESHGMVRTEALCRTCGAHLGHVFPDGPQPTGLRYCINSASLKFNARDESAE